MSEPIILYPWRVKHASGVEYVVVTRGTSHIEAISAAQEVERYKFDCGDTNARTFHTSPIVVLERQAPVWQAHDALLEEYKSLTAELRDMLDAAGLDARNVGLPNALRRALDVIAAEAGDNLR